jgi:hypothetical protein
MSIKIKDLDPATRAKLEREHPEAFSPARARKAEAVPLVQPGHYLYIDGEEWTIPLHLQQVTNGGAMKKHMIGVAGKHRRAVASAITRHLRWFAHFADLAQKGKPLRCTITRLGVRTMDDDNVQSAAKWVRDTVALFLGVDDSLAGPVRWEYGQEKGEAYGVRIKLEAL